MRFALIKIWLMVALLIPILVCAAESDKTLRIGLPYEMPPFSFYDKNINATRGFNVDLAVMLGKVLGTKVTLLGYHESELINALNRGQIDVIGCILKKTEPDSTIHLIDTGIQVERHLFTHNSCVTVTCLKDLSGQRVIHNKKQSFDHLEIPLTPVEVIESNSVSEALTSLNTGEADVYISGNSLTTLYQAQKLGLDNIKQVGMPFETVSLSLAVLKNRPELLSDLSLGLGKILQSEHYESLKQKWFGHGLESNIWVRYIRYIFMAVAGLALFLLIFAFWSLLLKRQVKRVTKNLVSSEHRYRELIESSPDMIHIITRSGQVQMINKKARDLLKSQAPDFADLFIPEQRKDIQDFVVTLFKTGHGDGEFVFLNSDDKQIPVELAATTYLCPDTTDLVASCFSRDVRIRKSLEEELIRSERLAIMGQMSAGLAHEINNPLGIISGYAQELLAGNLDEESQKESLKIIVNNCERANHIVKQLLSFSRQSPPIRKPVDLLTILDASLLLVKSEIKKRKISVQKEFPDSPVVVLGDEHQLVQVFINLLTNAAQAIPETGAITIRYTEPAHDQQNVVVDVQDNGSGITPAVLGKLFDPFYTTKENGFGLGLFVSNIIIRRHEGAILAESKEGFGTIMRVTLPLSYENVTMKKSESYA